MKNSNRYTGWMIPAVLFLVMLGTAGISWGATPKVAAGESHTVYLHADGTLWAAGLNQAGQLGDGTLVNRAAPVRIGSDNHWQTVAAGAAHTLALKADGTLWGWGSNASGQLGALGAGGLPVANQNAPLKIGTERSWVAVAAGTSSSYALKGDGTIWAWGLGTAGQNQPAAVPNPLAGGRFVALAAGSDHVLALQADGSLWSWGSNTFGQLGQGDTVVDPATPTQVLVATALTDNDWVAIAAGGGHSLALKSDGTLWSWGDNSSGQLGNGSTLPSNTPVQIGSDHDWSALAGGALHTLALKRNGTLWSWGDNSSGQLGNGQLSQQNAPVQILTPAGLTAVSGGAFHSVALKNNGAIYAWGGAADGQLGNGSDTPALAPVLIGNDGMGWVFSEPGTDFTVARRSNGTLWSWGNNSGGQLGNGTVGADPVGTPALVDTQDNWATHSAGSSHVIALKADGTLWTWGDNAFGQLGDNTSNPSSFPLQVVDTKPGTAAANDWAAVAAGDFHTLAIKGDGTLWAWGDNSFGQLGDNTNTPTGNQPNQIVLGPPSSDNTWVAVAAGGSHSLGLQSDGSLWAWGDNSQGQLGGDPADPLIGLSLNLPRQVFFFPTPGFSNNGWRAIAAGSGFSLGLQADGTLWAWGTNFDGELGSGDTALVNQFTPVQVLNPGAAPYVAVSAGDTHVVARQADGSLWSWGRNTSGQLGDGTADLAITPHATPVREVGAASDWIASATGGSHSVALKADGALWAWGNNVAGQIGDGSILDKKTPAVLAEGFATTAAALDFGTVFIGANGSTRNLAISNPGTGSLFVTGVTLSGTDAALFSVAPGSCGPDLAFVLPAGGSCNLQVTSLAAAPAGGKSAQLDIASSDPVLSQRQVALSAQSAQHAVTLNSGANGSIFGPVLVNENATPSYTIVPATTFHLTDVTVNGVSKGAVTALTLPPVTADVTIAATFAIDTFAVNFTSGGNGTLTGTVSQTVNSGAAATTVTAVPATGFHFVNWTEGATVVGTAATLTVTNVSAARTITANFAIDTFTVSFVSGGNGTLTGNLSQTVNFAASAAAVTAAPALGYHFVNWTEAGSPVATSAALTVGNVTANRTLTANFAIDTFSVSVTGDSKGTIAPGGSALIPFGGSQTYTFTATTGYQVVKVVADGVDQGAVPASTYTFNNVTAGGHTLKVSFIPDGDVNGDGVVNVSDALRALQLAVQLVPFTAQDMLHGDVSPLDGAGVPVPDHQMSVGDALGILRKAVSLPSNF